MNKHQQEAARQIKQAGLSLGHAPTQKQFAADPQSTLTARTISAMWPGGWAEALQAAGFTNKDSAEMLAALTKLGGKLGRMPSAKEVAADNECASPAVYARRFGSLKEALKKAGLAKLDRSSASFMVSCGLKLSKELGHLPSWSEWEKASQADDRLPSQWQVYRRFGGGDGAWKLFHYCLLEAAADSSS